MTVFQRCIERARRRSLGGVELPDTVAPPAGLTEITNSAHSSAKSYNGKGVFSLANISADRVMNGNKIHKGAATAYTTHSAGCNTAQKHDNHATLSAAMPINASPGTSSSFHG